MANLKAIKRKEHTFGKKYARQIRREGNVPAVIYGNNESPIAITLDPVQYVKELNSSDYKKNLIFEISIDEKTKERVITKEINVNPINNQFIHIDFQRVKDDVSIVVDIPVRISGISSGQRLGGVLVKPKSTVKVQCFPNNIPIDLEVDVTSLAIGDNVRADQLTLGDGQALISNPKDILVKVESTKVSKLAQADDNQQSDDSPEAETN